MHEIKISTMFVTEEPNRSHLKKEGAVCPVIFKTGCVNAIGVVIHN